MHRNANSSEVLSYEVDALSQPQEVLVVPWEEPPLVSHRPNIAWETGETRLELEKGGNLDDAQVLQSLHPRPPPPARSLNIHLVELAPCGVCEGGTTCNEKLGRVMQVTLKARLSRWTARGRRTEKRMNNEQLEPECLKETVGGSFLSGPLHPVDQPAVFQDLPQVLLVDVQQLLQQTIDIASHFWT